MDEWGTCYMCKCTTSRSVPYIAVIRCISCLSHSSMCQQALNYKPLSVIFTQADVLKLYLQQSIEYIKPLTAVPLTHQFRSIVRQVATYCMPSSIYKANALSRMVAAHNADGTVLRGNVLSATSADARKSATSVCRPLLLNECTTQWHRS